MLQNSFIFLERFGRSKERSVWKQGILDWRDFLSVSSVKGISKKTKGRYNRLIQHAERALRRDDALHFSHLLPLSEHYRLYDHFRDSMLFLDIETTTYYNDITVIGMYDGRTVMTMVKGYNLDKELLVHTLKRYDVIVSFNGRSFDIPAINKYFGITIDKPHIDLRYVCSRIGLNGGLKAIEQELGIKREDGVVGVTGEDAIYLWESFRLTKDPVYLKKLIRYNTEDIVNLAPLADYAIPLLWEQVRRGDG